MDNKKCINFQISLRNNLGDLKREKTSKDSIILVRRAITSICSIFSDKQLLADTTFAIRYLKDSSGDLSHVKTYFVIGRSQNEFSSEEIEGIEANLNATLGRIFKLNQCQLDWRNLNCINTVSEVIKHEIFDEENHLYIPKFLKTSKTTELESVLDYMETLNSKVVLEVCLQPYHQPNEQRRWMEAMRQMIQGIQSNIQNNPSSRIILDEALIEYLAYQKHYLPDAHLFGYAIRAYGEKQSHVQALLHTFKDIAISHENSTDCTIIHTNPQSEALAIQKTSAIERSEWKNSLLVNAPINKLSQTAKKGWGKFGDGSLNVDNLFNSGISLRQTASWNQQLLPQEGNQSSQLIPSVKNGEIKHSEIPIQKTITITDLKPLHQLVCLEEVQGFLGLSISSKIQVFHPIMTAEKIFDKYCSLITKDTYIVGIDDNEEPVLSTWSAIPHRLIAGLPGSGKTNFLNWIIFQFLFVNPRRKVYISDFGGVDFQYLKDLNLNVEIVDDLEECTSFVEKIHREEYERRLELMKQHKVSNIASLEHEEVDIDRTLWIIDEAADIADAKYKLKEAIENRLKEYARKGRKYAIQVLYCTQRPTTEVISKQVTDQCEEKIVFRVSPDASQRILDDAIAGTISKKERGRCWLDGHAGRMFVNVPKIEKPEGTSITIEDTLWRHFIK